VLRVDAAGTKEQQLTHIEPISHVNQIRLNHEVLIDEITTMGIVSLDTSDLGSTYEHIFRSSQLEPFIDLLLISQVDTIARNYDVLVTDGSQMLYKG
jgi:hypothetical protein